MTHQLPGEERHGSCFSPMNHTETPMHLLLAFRDIRRLGVPVSPKADSKGQHPGIITYYCLSQTGFSESLTDTAFL